MTDVVRDPYGNPLRQDTKIVALRQARIDALEEAAQVADDHRLPLGDFRAPYKIAAAIRAEVEKLKALTVKADEAIERQQQDLEEAADRAADCDILRAEVEKLRAALELFACDCIDSGNLCPSTQNCRNYIARAVLEGKL